MSDDHTQYLTAGHRKDGTSLLLEQSPHLDRLLSALQAAGYDVAVVEVDYELQRGGNQMLRIRHHRDEGHQSQTSAAFMTSVH